MQSMSEFETEFELIEKLTSKLKTRSTRVLKGLGDDTAVLEPSTEKILFCSDLMIESIHFDLKFITPQELGHKALASCFSDLVAMNGTGLGATVSLALPKSTGAAFIDAFYEGLNTFAEQAEIECVGGDLSASPSLIYIDIACVGESAKPVYRSGAKQGDLLIVSGTPGASAAGFEELRQNGSTSEVLRQKHLRPMPRFDLQPLLSELSSLIDISDGLASETHHLAKASGVGFKIESHLIPLHPDALRAAGDDADQALDWALYGGEDYELLATIAPEKSVPAGFTVIGRAVEGPDVVLVKAPLNGNSETERKEIRLSPRGFDHFRR